MTCLQIFIDYNNFSLPPFFFWCQFVPLYTVPVDWLKKMRRIVLLKLIFNWTHFRFLVNKETGEIGTLCWDCGSCEFISFSCWSVFTFWFICSFPDCSDTLMLLSWILIVEAFSSTISPLMMKRKVAKSTILYFIPNAELFRLQNTNRIYLLWGLF